MADLPFALRSGRGGRGRKEAMNQAIKGHL